MPVQGTWFGLPDYGITEMLRELAGKTPSAQVTTNFNNPAVYQARQQQSFAGNNLAVPAVKGVSTQQTPTNNPQNFAIGGGGGGGGAGGGQPTGGGSGISEQDLAAARRRSMIDSYRAQASNLRNEGQSTFDNILKAVNAFRDRSKEQFTNAGQEIVNRASGILGQNARDAAETEGEARARGRALGLGDSSKFNLQNKVAGNLAATQGNTIAKRGEEDRSNLALLNERNDQAQGQEDQANTYLKGVRDRASALENAGYDAADETYSSALNDIVNYQRQLAAINPVNAQGLTQYAPNFSGITNTINGILSGLGGGTGGSNPDDFANPVNPTNIFDILKKKGLVTG